MRLQFPTPVAILALVTVALGCTPPNDAPRQQRSTVHVASKQPTSTSAAPPTAPAARTEPEAPTDDAQARARRAARAAASRLDFGAISLGTPIRALPRGATWQPGCDAPLLQQCGFDLNGVSYGTDWEDNIVVIKTIRVGDEPPRRLPFGLRGDEAMYVALAHLNSRFYGAFEVGRNDAGETFVIAHSETEKEGYFEVSLRFEREGRLSEVRASCCYN